MKNEFEIYEQPLRCIFSSSAGGNAASLSQLIDGRHSAAFGSRAGYYVGFCRFTPLPVTATY